MADDDDIRKLVHELDMSMTGPERVLAQILQEEEMTSQQESPEVQEGSQATPKPSPQKTNEAPKGDKETPKYTEAQWSKMRRSLQSRINELESDRNALSAHADTLESDNDALKGTVIELKKEIDDGVPEEATEVVKRYRQRLADLVTRESEHKANVRKFEGRIADIDRTDREALAQSLSEKFGVDYDELLNQPNPEKMKAYALDNFDLAKVKTEEPKAETPVGASEPVGEKLEAPVLPAGGAGSKTRFTAEEIDNMDTKTFAEHRELVLKALTEGKID
jgi:septal ring factor EnvC (AmiA/AmiB activator)